MDDKLMYIPKINSFVEQIIIGKVYTGILNQPKFNKVFDLTNYRICLRNFDWFVQTGSVQINFLQQYRGLLVYHKVGVHHFM